MEELYFTVTGFEHYYGKRPFSIGSLICCCKEPQNRYDGEAIVCSLPPIGTIGYVANSPSTVAGGTMSAGRLYDRVEDFFYARVMFTTASKIICRVEREAQWEVTFRAEAGGAFDGKEDIILF